MTGLVWRHWARLGTGALALAAASGLSACGEGAAAGEGGGAAGRTGAVAGEGEGEGGGARPAAATAAAAAAAATAPAGESGEAGAQAAYDGVPEASRPGLAIAHLAGFLLVAEAVNAAGRSDEASALIGQGLLEVHDPQGALFASAAPDLKPALDRAMAALDTGKSKRAGAAALKSARQTAERALRAAGGDPAVIAAGMASLSSGLYQGVATAEGVDPVEYMHAHGAALSALWVAETGERALARRDRERARRLRADLQALGALFPQLDAPDTPQPANAVAAAASRVALTASGLAERP